MAIPPDLAQRVSAARTDRSRRQGQINDFLRYADPTKPRIGDAAGGATDRSNEADDLFDTTMQEVVEDFASDLQSRIMPRQANWLAYEPEEMLPDEVKAQLADPLKARTTAIFSAIRGSDFFNEAAGEWAMDMGHGTAALIGVDPGAGQPHHWEAIPPSQLLLERGTAGGTSFRGREYRMAAEEALAFWPDYQWSRAFRRKAGSTTGRRQMVRVLEAADRQYEPGDEVWRWRVCVDDELAHEEWVKGRGSCPIIASRWRTHSTSAWGIGPLLKSTPDAKTLDQERYLILKNLGKVVDPPVAYDDDGVMNPEGGVGAGMWIPRSPGSKVEVLPVEGQVQAAYYEQGKLQDNIRRAGFQDGPRQDGKTPPTLGQWMDQKSDEGRRLEMPTGKLYAEGVIAVVERTEWMLQKAGKIGPAVKLPNSSQLIKVRPLNPLSKQQDMEEVSTAEQLLQAGNAIFGPQVLSAIVDGGATFLKIKAKLNDELIVVRAPSDAQPLLQGVLHAQDGSGQPAPDGGQ